MNPVPRTGPLPVTVLCGFLGSGKATLLNHVLHNRAGRRLAVIVNVMSEVNIDAALVRDGGANLSRTEEKLVEMSNGCICCTLREDLLKEVRKLAEEGRFDYLLIINKTDQLTPAQAGELEGILRALNPGAKLVRSEWGRVPLGEVLDMGRFDFEKAKANPGWLKELRGEHVPETEEYGISTPRSSRRKKKRSAWRRGKLSTIPFRNGASPRRSPGTTRRTASMRDLPKTHPLRRAWEAWLAGRADEAHSHYLAAVVNTPDLAEAQQMLGYLALEMEDDHTAALALGQSVMLDPDIAESQMLFGVALRRKGERESAVAAFAKALTRSTISR